MVVVTVPRLGTVVDISSGRVLYVMGPGLGLGRHTTVLDQWGWQLDTFLLVVGKVDRGLLKLGLRSGPLQLILDLSPRGGVGILNAWHFRALVTPASPGGIEVL